MAELPLAQIVPEIFDPAASSELAQSFRESRDLYLRGNVADSFKIILTAVPIGGVIHQLAQVDVDRGIEFHPGEEEGHMSLNDVLDLVDKGAKSVPHTVIPPKDYGWTVRLACTNPDSTANCSEVAPTLKLKWHGPAKSPSHEFEASYSTYTGEGWTETVNADDLTHTNNYHLTVEPGQNLVHLHIDEYPKQHPQGALDVTLPLNVTVPVFDGI